MTKGGTAPNPRKEPVQERSRHTVAAILEAAAQVFARDGYDATTTRIAERAGVSVGTLYQYFPNKDALLVALARRHVSRAHARVEAALDEIGTTSMKLKALVRHLVDAMVDVHLDEPELHRVLFEECPRKASIPEVKGTSDAELLARLVGVIKSHPDVRVANVEVATAMVAQTTEALCHGYVLNEALGTMPRELFEAELTRMITSYLVGG